MHVLGKLVVAVWSMQQVGLNYAISGKDGWIAFQGPLGLIVM